MNRREVGKQYEEAAARALIGSGYQILERNFWCRQGEIDIIASHKGYLVFVEVKYRRNERAGFPEEAVNRKKQMTMVKTARYYMYKKGYASETPCRFDVAAVDGGQVRIIEDAFWA